MTPHKQRKQRDRKERLRVHKHTAPPRRPFQKDPRRLSRGEAARRFTSDLEDAIARAEEQWKKEQRFFDAIKEMREVCRPSSGEPMLLQEPDGRLTPFLELKARFPGYHNIILPPKDPAEVEAQTETEPVTDTHPPIVEFPIDGHPGWRIAMVPASRLNLVPPSESHDEDELLDEDDDDEDL